jgi:sterol desaturase/sphingolipid hydroxylase (fatty acid hydroxylase superfamily)
VLTTFFEQIWLVISSQAPWWIGFGICFTVLASLSGHACNPGKVWWRNPGLATDVLFCVLSDIIGPYLRIIAILLVAVFLAGLSADGVADFIAVGTGPLSGSPFWLQLAVYVLGSDLLLYWSHRIFHGRVLWPFHAVHHSPEELDWTSAYRFHPVNRLFSSILVSIIMLKLGVPPWLMIALVPIDAIISVWVHANLNWTFGPLKYVVATPVFHRWHHTGVDEGGSSNFAPTFPFIDVVFGTFYMPEGKLPQTYGVDDPGFPKDFAGLVIAPFASSYRELRRSLTQLSLTRSKAVQRADESSERI